LRAGDNLAMAVLCFPLAAVGFHVARRMAESGVWIGTDSVVVRGPVRTRVIATRDAIRFAAGASGAGANSTPMPVLIRSNGGPVGVWALGKEGFIWQYEPHVHRLEPVCDDLNDTLRAAQTEHPG
jgi:hypothetical protein